MLKTKIKHKLDQTGGFNPLVIPLIIAVVLVIGSSVAAVMYYSKYTEQRDNNKPLIEDACSLTFLTVFGIIGGSYIISSKRRIHSFTQTLTRYLNRMLHIVRPKHPETIGLKRVEKVFNETHENYLLVKEKFPEMKRPFFYAMIANITEIATIYVVYIAYGQYVNPGAVIIAYALANFAGLIAVLPGGIGVYEGLMSAVLISAGVPAGLAISVTVMYRVINMALSLPVGYYFYHKALHRLGGSTS